MSQTKPLVVLGFIGTVLDFAGRGEERWKKWRPTVGLCQQPDLPVARLELLHDRHSLGLAKRLEKDIVQTSPSTTVSLQEVKISDPWDFELMYTTLLDFAQRYPFDTDKEDYLIHITTGTHVAQICWFLLTEARYFPAKLVQTSPAPRLQQGDIEIARRGKYSLIDLDLSRYDQIAQRFVHQQHETQAFLKAGIATQNPAFNRTIAQIERVADRSRAPMLLIGPTGAGKSFLARRIYELKRHRHQLSGAFVEVNCATLRGDSAMSTLFGHVRGAFTGAQQDRPGLLRAAHGGLLFLDEIGELGLDEQAMLLKAIEEKHFFPFGSDKEVSSDFQLIAGTHRNLRQWVAEGKFREDLLARINLWTFDLPGLAQRPEDIAPNLDFELQRFAAEQGEQIRFSHEAKAAYLHFATSSEARWQGNFRELSASVTRLATLADAGRITETQVEEEIGRLRQAWQVEDAPQKGQTTSSTRDLVSDYLSPEACASLDLFDRCQLNSVLSVCEQASTLSAAGRILFAISRQERKQANDADRLRKYLARFALSFEQIKQQKNTV